MKSEKRGLIMQNKIFAWIALVVGLFLLIPLIAMQFTNEVVWSWFDFLLAGGLLFVAGATFVLIARRMPRHLFLVGAVVTLITIAIWVELAVGFFTSN